MRAALMIAVLAVAVPDRPDPTPKEARPLQEQLQGEWQVVAALTAGKPIATLKPGEAVFIFAGDRLTISRPTLENVYEFTIDATPNPAAISVRSKRIAGKEVNGAPVMGILKIEGDLLSICLRPVNGFASTPETKATLWQVKRAK
jgi:uncharacterized protein (TIGR03067 family)